MQIVDMKSLATQEGIQYLGVAGAWRILQTGIVANHTIGILLRLKTLITFS